MARVYVDNRCARGGGSERRTRQENRSGAEGIRGRVSPPEADDGRQCNPDQNRAQPASNSSSIGVSHRREPILQ